MFEKLNTQPTDFIAAYVDAMGQHSKLSAAGRAEGVQAGSPTADGLGIIYKAQGKIRELEAEVEALSRQLRKKKDKKAAIEEKLTAAVNQFETVNTEKIQIIAAKTQAEAELSAVKTEAETKSTELETLKAELEALKTQVATLTAEKTALEADKTDLTAKLAAKAVGAENADGAPKGDAEAEVANLTAEQAAERVQDAERDPLLVQFEALEAKANDPINMKPSDIKEFSAFIKKNRVALAKYNVMV